MKIKYYFSACVQITTSNNLKILCDPWFTPGAYMGSWHQFPLKKDPINMLDNPDLIYISHIHPDHYDPIFLKKIFKKFGKKKVLISKLKNNYLLLRSKFDGIDATPIESLKIKNNNIHIVPNDTESNSDIDSALVVNDGKFTFLNLNDCMWNKVHVEKIKEIIKSYKDKVDFMALGYSGAGPYPQTYFDQKKEYGKLISEAKIKEDKFLNLYKKYCSNFKADLHLPFAGKYILGGKLWNLNKFRGSIDPIEIKKFDKKAIILKDFGKNLVDLKTKKIIGAREKSYSSSSINRSIKKNKGFVFDYEKDIKININQINFVRLLFAATNKAIRKSEMKESYRFIFSITEKSKIYSNIILEINKSKFSIKNKTNSINKKITNTSKIIIDYRLLYGLLTSIYHWDNVKVGSHYMTRRSPNKFVRSAENFLNFLSAA